MSSQHKYAVFVFLQVSKQHLRDFHSLMDNFIFIENVCETDNLSHRDCNWLKH